MRLSDLQTGERGVIVKVSGHGGFRKRIIEMGFVSGQDVEVLLNAPLQDPVKYRIMGYEVSLRHDEAAMIEVVGPDEAQAETADEGHEPLTLEHKGEEGLHAAARRHRHTIRHQPNLTNPTTPEKSATTTPKPKNTSTPKYSK